MRTLKLMIGTFLLLFLTGCGLLSMTPPKGLTAEQGRGWGIYTRRCAACHRIKGKGGGSASELTHIARRRDAAWLRKWIKDPKSVAPRVKMPPPNLSDSQIDDVVSYLTTLK